MFCEPKYKKYHIVVGTFNIYFPSFKTVSKLHQMTFIWVVGAILLVTVIPFQSLQIKKPILRHMKPNIQIPKHSTFSIDSMDHHKLHIKPEKVSLETVEARNRNSIQYGITSFLIQMSCFLYVCQPDKVMASGEEAVQLLYGYHTNIPYTVTWLVLLYGAYKVYFGVFRWLASM